VSLCDVCLTPLGVYDIGGICHTCYADWLDYQEAKRDDEPRETE